MTFGTGSGQPELIPDSAQRVSVPTGSQSDINCDASVGATPSPTLIGQEWPVQLLIAQHMARGQRQSRLVGRHIRLGRRPSRRASALTRFVQRRGVAGSHAPHHQLHRLSAVLDHGAGQAQLLARSSEAPAFNVVTVSSATFTPS